MHVVGVDVDGPDDERRDPRRSPATGSTFASWSSVVTTISSPGCSVAPIERPTWNVSVVMLAPNLISLGDAGVEQVGQRRVGLADDRVAAPARHERAAVVGVRLR